MARPTLPVDMLSDGTRISNAEREARAAMERELRGKSDRLDPPAEWSDERKGLFEFIVRECFPEDSLCNLDYFLLEELAISLDRKAKLDMLIDHEEWRRCPTCRRARPGNRAARARSTACATSACRGPRAPRSPTRRLA